MITPEPSHEFITTQTKKKKKEQNNTKQNTLKLNKNTNKNHINSH